MNVITPEMRTRRLHAMHESDGVHDLHPLFDAAVVSPHDLQACRQCGLICVTEDGFARLPLYLKPWVRSLTDDDFGAILPKASLPYDEPVFTA